MTAKKQSMDLASIVVDEGLKFQRRTNLKGADGVWGGLAWGLMRALAFCECCEEMRIPQDKNWDVLWCPRCKGVWKRRQG